MNFGGTSMASPRIITRKKTRQRMKKARNKFLYLLFFSCAFNFFTATAQQDTARVLGFIEYMQWVETQHPVSKQAALIPGIADAYLLKARGDFDPKAFYQINGKRYDEKTYYRMDEGGVQLNTWPGVDVKLGYENNNGLFINPEDKLPTSGLVYSQISVPLWQGIVTDARRTAFKQARLLQQMSSWERIQLVNEIRYKAGKAYLDWFLAKKNLSVLELAYRVSAERLQGVKQSVVLGDRAGIDSVEASIQVQDRWMAVLQGRWELSNKQYLVSAYLWDQEQPVLLDVKVRPDSVINFQALENFVTQQKMQADAWEVNHPGLKLYGFKLEQLRVDQALRREMLKPQIRAIYNPLADAGRIRPDFTNNFKWGLSTQLPLLWRKERADLRLNAFKTTQTELERQYKRNEWSIRIRTFITEMEGYREQYSQYAQNIRNYEALTESERQLFNNGESNLFMINARETNYFQALLKWNDWEYKGLKAALDLQEASGQFFY
jgi:outer membrane protein TolC